MSSLLCVMEQSKSYKFLPLLKGKLINIINGPGKTLRIRCMSQVLLLLLTSKYYDACFIHVTEKETV